MKVLLDIEDDKADFVMEWLHGLSFVKAEPLDVQGELKKISLQEIKVNDTLYTFKEALSAGILLEDEMFFVTYPELNIEVWGYDLTEAAAAFKFALQAIIKNIYLEDDEKLTDNAITIKSVISSMLK